jgi:hypothetical protein
MFRTRIERKSHSNHNETQPNFSQLDLLNSDFLAIQNQRNFRKVRIVIPEKVSLLKCLHSYFTNKTSDMALQFDNRFYSLGF